MSNHPIPSAALDDRLAFLGLGGSGKTYNAGGAVERLLDHNARVCIIDPLGAWWGLRLTADGKEASDYNIVIFGGPHADIAITEQSGALVGETVANMAESCILDLSEIGSDAAERRFMLAFLTALYKHQSKSLLHLIIDEADMWAPQQIFDKEGGAAQLVGKMQNIVRRGRIKGFIPWLITQRPAVLSWGVLSQVVGIVAFTLTSSQDRDAIGRWVKGQADKDRWNEIWTQLAELPVGDGLVWVPRRKLFGIKAFPQKKTFDSSRAPKRGEKRTSRKLKPLDVGKLKERLAAVEAEAAASNPAKLKAEIAALKAEKARLEKQATTAVAAKRPPDKDALKKIEARAIERAKKQLVPLLAAMEAAMKFVVEINAKCFFKSGDEAVDKAAVDKAILAGSQEVKRLIKQHLGRRGKEFDALRLEARRLAERLKKFVDQADSNVTVRVDVVQNEPFTVSTGTAPRQVRSIVRPAAPIGDGTYTTPQLKVLRSLAMWRSLGHDPASREMVAAVAGYSPTSGGYGNLLGSLKTLGAIDYPTQGQVTLATAENLPGIDAISPDEGRELFLSILSNPQRKIIGALLGQGVRSRAEVGEATGYSPTSGGYGNLLGSMRTLKIVDYPQQGTVALVDWAQELLSGLDGRLAA